MASRPEDASDLIRRHALSLLAIAHNGLTYAGDPFDRQRYGEVLHCAEELLGLITDCGLETLRTYSAGDIGHMTPKISVRGALFAGDGAVLLVQERADQRWTLPGGWCDLLDSPSQAVAKEMREEAGLVVDVEKIVAVLGQDKRGASSLPHVVQMFFLCREVERVPPDLTETSAIDWFDVEALPALSSSVRQEHIRLAHDHWLTPSLPPMFD